MPNWKRLLVLVAFTSAVGVASFAVEDEVNAQTAGSAGTAAPSAGTNSGGTSSTPTAGTGTTGTDSEKKDSGGGCTIAAPASSSLAALFGLAVGLAFLRRRKES